MRLVFFHLVSHVQFSDKLEKVITDMTTPSPMVICSGRRRHLLGFTSSFDYLLLFSAA